jgi:predicted transcriptional regulator
MPDSTFTFRVDDDLKAAFAEVAGSQERTAAQLLRVLMREAVQAAEERREYDAWFRREVEQAVTEADDPGQPRLDHGEVLSQWQQQRAAIERRVSGRSA